jgi:hypothetical protein
MVEFGIALQPAIEFVTKIKVPIKFVEQLEDDASAEGVESLDLTLSPKPRNFLRLCGKWFSDAVFRSAFIISRAGRSQPGLTRRFDHAASPTFGNELRNSSIEVAVMKLRDPILRASSRLAPISR